MRGACARIALLQAATKIADRIRGNAYSLMSIAATRTVGRATWGGAGKLLAMARLRGTSRRECGSRPPDTQARLRMRPMERQLRFYPCASRSSGVSGHLDADQRMIGATNKPSLSVDGRVPIGIPILR